jgi:serine protease AprX
MKNNNPLSRRIIFSLISLVLLLNLAGQSTNAISTASSHPWDKKVSPQVVTASQGGDTEFLVIMKDQADLSYAAKIKSKAEKGTYVFETLKTFAAATQQPIHAILDDLGSEYQPFWVANMIWVRGNYEVVQRLAQMDQVSQIESNPFVRFDTPEINQDPIQPQAVTGIEWNISKINAPEAWALGYTGEGIVIGGQDTGYDWVHPALKNKYRGWNGTTADHNYNWHDTVTSGGGGCGPSTSEPCDDYGHGTHTMGTMVGDDGGTNQIGMAPDAKWIGCRNMNVGVGTPSSYMECYQWFIAPYDLIGDDSDADPLKAPHVINNSWSCPTSEGCTTPGILLAAVQSVRAAGIVTVHSAGNEGPGCSSVADPATIYEESFSVGSISSNDNIASTSSRGPVTVDGSNRLKPNVVAPGVSIYSSTNGGSYGLSSGTSMAAPHVAGLVALLLSANPGLIGQVDQIENIIEGSAVPLTTSETCGGIPGSSIPNNTFGWGRIDALAAILASFNIYIPLITK